jgi:AcrR family transcriptional regulator
MPLAAPESEQKRNAGRPRCQAARESILETTARLLRNSSVRELAIESIAREAGVGKATIYRWWPNKAAIVIDAFFSEAAPLTNFPAASSASEAIQAQCAKLIEVLNGPLGTVLAQIIGEGQSNEDVLAKFREVFLRHRRAEFIALYDRGVREGVFKPGLDVELAADLVYGPVWFRLLVAHQPLDEKFAEQLPNLAVAALAA